ncbi:Crp/Fnr family transcriptional regulator [Flavobacterium antarcticum]|uniref:Crp/Fnr family transcriptional regulator n=1 Tax=Flavobacterium antarcticum TaxID=271155 RepID=UPI0003B40980|nr:Crp/Fnr family transcriptional regulator [Flavobacterium antarcticum]
MNETKINGSISIMNSKLMTNHDNIFLEDVFKDFRFTEDDRLLLSEKLEKLEFKKGTSLLKAGEKVTDQYYVESGCLRTYFIDESGKEHTLQFAIHDWWISDYTAFFSEEKGILNIEILQDSVLYRVSKKELDVLFTEVQGLNAFFRKKMERAFASFQKRILANLSQSATERYLDFVANYPNIEQQVKNYHIASYLGITTETLSRIRKELSYL